MRPLWGLKRLIRRHKWYHPIRAIYYEAVRRHFFFLGLRWGSRYTPKLNLPLPALPMPTVTTKLEDWPAPPDWVMVLLPPLPEQEVVYERTGTWRDYYLSEHPHLRRNTEPIDKVPTVRILEEDTIKARAIVKGYHEERNKEQSC